MKRKIYVNRPKKMDEWYDEECRATTLDTSPHPPPPPHSQHTSAASAALPVCPNNIQRVDGDTELCGTSIFN